MSGQNAEQSGGFKAADSRLDAILEQLHALGSSAHAQDGPPSRLRSVPDLHAEPSAVPLVDEPVSETTVDEVVPHEQPQPLDSAPSLELIPPPIEPVLMEPVPPASSLEMHDELELVIEPPDTPFIAPPLPPAPAEVQQDPVELFEALHEPVEHAQASFEAPQQNVDEAVSVSPPPPLPLPPSPVPVPAVEPDATDHDAGWISHHEGETPADSTPDDPRRSTQDTTDDNTPDWDALREVLQPTEVDTPIADSAFGVPNWADAEVEAPDERSPEFEGELIETMSGGTDLFELPDSIDGLTSHLDAEPPIELAEIAAHDSSPYQSDEDLPLPDFTGVYAETSDAGMWPRDAADEAARAIPEPVESKHMGSGISVGRNELDSLRPVEETAVVNEQPKLGRKLQLMGVVLFGLLALAVIFLDDPAVVDELREIYEGFFG